MVVNGADVKPTSANTKDEIIKYLTDHNITFDPNAKKDDLLTLIK